MVTQLVGLQIHDQPGPKARRFKSHRVFPASLCRVADLFMICDHRSFLSHVLTQIMGVGAGEKARFDCELIIHVAISPVSTLTSGTNQNCQNLFE
jgi:hypothetical protein